MIAESQESSVEESSVVDRLLPAVDGFVLAMSRLDDDAIREVAGFAPTVLVNRVVDGVDGHDMRMVERGHGERFARESLAPSVV